MGNRVACYSFLAVNFGQEVIGWHLIYFLVLNRTLWSACRRFRWYFVFNTKYWEVIFILALFASTLVSQTVSFSAFPYWKRDSYILCFVSSIDWLCCHGLGFALYRCIFDPKSNLMFPTFFGKHILFYIVVSLKILFLFEVPLISFVHLYLTGWVRYFITRWFYYLIWCILSYPLSIIFAYYTRRRYTKH